MKKKLRPTLFFITGTCIGLLIIACIIQDVITIILLAFAIALILFLLLLLDSEKKNKQLQKQIKQQKKYNQQISQDNWNLEQWKSSVYTVVPDIDEKLEDNKAHEMANEFDETYQSLAKLIVDSSDFDKYCEALSTYNKFSLKIKSLVTIDINQIKENYQKMLNTQTEIAFKNINHGLSKYKPVAREYDSWQRLVDYYEGLPQPVQEELEKNKYIVIKHLYDGFTASKDDKMHKEAFN